jgi:heat shock protein HslJ
MLRTTTTSGLIALAIVGALALAGCGTEPAVPLETTFWVCAQISADGELTDVLGDSFIDLYLQNGQATGSSGCNRYNGAYAVDGDSITIGPLMSTLIACEEPLMEQEQAFLAALEAAEAYSIEGETLTLSGADGAALAVFEADTTPLTGSEWMSTGYNNGAQAVVSPILETTMTIQFTEDGTAKGSSGCNTYSMTYETDEAGGMTFGAISVTEMACEDPPGVMEQERLFLEALSEVATYELQGDLLTLRWEDGAAAATFVRP